MKGGAAAALVGRPEVAVDQAEEVGHDVRGSSDGRAHPEVGSLMGSAALGADPVPGVGPELTAYSGLAAAAEAEVEPTPGAAEPTMDSGLGSRAQPCQVVRTQDHASERTQSVLP